MWWIFWGNGLEWWVWCGIMNGLMDMNESFRYMVGDGLRLESLLALILRDVAVI